MKTGRAYRFRDRRIKTRHAASTLKVTLHKTGLRRYLLKPIEVTCIDFNRYGISVEASLPFHLNERISVDFKGRYIAQTNISGFISSKVKKNGIYRLGITFSNFTSNKEYSRKIDDALARIETLYNEHYKSNT